ncbi:MAG: hypothetical protein ACSHW7_12270 [Patiriisocius sp.]|uniref:hypothetical protein n=1 Tax=Patiriisocius sp. TaxID=2822396 RepID=UPI003EF0A6F3
MSKPKNTITVALAKKLRKNWNHTRAIDLETSRGSKDVSDVTFSLSELEEFVEYVRGESDNQKIENPGVRVFFAAYNEDDNDGATVFLAPTKGTVGTSENNYDIDPLNMGGQGWPPNQY